MIVKIPRCIEVENIQKYYCASQIHNNNAPYMVYKLLCTLVYSFLNSMHDIAQKNRRKNVVYQTPCISLINIVNSLPIHIIFKSHLILYYYTKHTKTL